ncbi:MAG: hypothetical protein AB8B89_04600 [Gammaproteobacteria bacterium]
MASNKFTGKLNKRLIDRSRELTVALLRDDINKQNQISQEINEEINEKLSLLCEHYGLFDIEPQEKLLYELSLSLARDFVPGFKLENKVGAPTKWSLGVLQDLYNTVNTLRSSRSPRGSVNWACIQLARQEQWKSIIKQESTSPEKVLESYYYKAKNSQAALAKSFKNKVLK